MGTSKVIKKFRLFLRRVLLDILGLTAGSNLMFTENGECLYVEYSFSQKDIDLLKAHLIQDAQTNLNKLTYKNHMVHPTMPGHVLATFGKPGDPDYEHFFTIPAPNHLTVEQLKEYIKQSI